MTENSEKEQSEHRLSNLELRVSLTREKLRTLLDKAAALGMQEGCIKNVVGNLIHGAVILNTLKEFEYLEECEEYVELAIKYLTVLDADESKLKSESELGFEEYLKLREGEYDHAKRVVGLL